MLPLQTPFTVANFIPTLLPVSNKLNQCLMDIFNHQCKDTPELLSRLSDSERIVFNFRDKTYSAEAGGFHPVEIAFTKEALNKWQYTYITDFAFVGNDFPELIKEIDFDFLNEELFASYLGKYSPLQNNEAAIELYPLWECNFLAYVDMEVYDEIVISFT